MKVSIQRNGKQAAVIILNRDGGSIEIDYLKVEPEFRGKGFATVLLNKAKVFAARHGLELFGFVDPTRDSGLHYEQEIAWLKRHGFKSRWHDYGGYRKRVMAFHAPKDLTRSSGELE
jgi:GNAT superfamily N-acetyltransferase